MSSDPRAVDNSLRWIADEQVTDYFKLFYPKYEFKDANYFQLNLNDSLLLASDCDL